MRQVLEYFGEFFYLLWDMLCAIGPALWTGRGRRMAWRNLWIQMNRIGVDSIPIVGLVMFCIGAILAMQMAPELAKFGIIPVTADVVALATFREMGPLVSAVVMTGFGGAAITAEIGTMVVGEEIEAMETMAIDPIRYLVVPRVLAGMVMLVCLTALGDMASLFGGLVTSALLLHLGAQQYIHHALEILKIGDFLTGLMKAAVFGVLISAIACFLGLKVHGGAEGVGVNTSKTVVFTIVALIVVDLMFTALFFYLGV
jgi:phospholipid/cholesterol/gamma-HCH transport system permease protein